MKAPFSRWAQGIAAVFAVGIVVVAAASGASSRVANPAQEKTIFVFACFPPNIAYAWANGWYQARAALKGVDNVVIKAEGSFDPDPASYLSFIKTAMIQQPDGIVIVPNNGAGMSSGVRQLQQQYPNTKIVVMDAPIPNVDVTGFVGTDNFKAGEQAAGWLIQQYKQHKLKSNELAVFAEPAGESTSQNARVEGLLAGIKGSPLHVVKTVAMENQDATAAKAAMADVLVAHPNIGGVFSATDLFSVGVASTLAAKHALDVEQVSVDAQPAAVELMIKHQGVNAEIAQHMKFTGYKSVMTVADALAGKPVVKNFNTGTTLVTPSNAQSYLKVVAAENAH